jgi:cysteinyl-tRNA synthetase
LIQFTNTLGHKLEQFVPIREGEVRLYTCGPTVWNFPHIGNYRTFLFEDLLKRFLRYRGFKVSHVMNLTDVDDRIIKVCNENGIGLKELTGKYTKAFFEDLEFLRVELADHYPRATDYVNEMVEIIRGLLVKKFAYKTDDGSIYFSITKFPHYGELSGIKQAELKVGARVRVDDYGKDSAEDFALWKAWDEKDGKIFWETPIGKGRPGWHIECSAMSMKLLGAHFDIHTGGVDNIFPHHENEIAQSEGYTGEKFVNYWLHCEHLLVNEAKMAKRLGNFVTVRDLRERGADGPTLRYFLLSGHYRSQLNFAENSLEQAAGSVKRINEFVSRLTDALRNVELNENGSLDAEALSLVIKTRESYVSALDRDLDVPSALAVVFDLIAKGNRLLDRGNLGRRAVLSLLEFMKNDFDALFAVLVPEEKESLGVLEIRLLEERQNARRMKDWKLSDELRKRLLALGVEVQDTSQGQKWRTVAKDSGNE